MVFVHEGLKQLFFMLTNNLIARVNNIKQVFYRSNGTTEKNDFRRQTIFSGKDQKVPIVLRP